MTTDDALERWERARQGVLDRWRHIAQKIDAHDEPGVLALANVMDEFCEEADVARETSASGRRDPGGSPLKVLNSGGPSGSRCFFCRGFTDIGGCFGMLDDLNQAVMKGHWEKARSVARSYIRRLESMDVRLMARDRVH